MYLYKASPLSWDFAMWFADSMLYGCWKAWAILSSILIYAFNLVLLDKIINYCK